MLSRVIYWMICSLLVWLCSACCRSETYYVDQEVKDFTVFQPGSWWVYVDSVSGRRDSIVLEKVNEFETVYPGGPNCDRAEVDKLISSSYSVFKRENGTAQFEFDTASSKGNFIFNYPSTPNIVGKKQSTSAGIFFRERLDGSYRSELIGSTSIRVYDSIPPNQFAKCSYLRILSSTESFFYEIVYQKNVGCVKEILINNSQNTISKSVTLVNKK